MNTSNPSIAVVGATGHTGQFVVQEALRRGMAAFGEKNYPEAIACLTQASQRIADSPDLYDHLGCAHLLKGELDPAAAAFIWALRLRPITSIITGKLFRRFLAMPAASFLTSGVNAR